MLARPFRPLSRSYLRATMSVLATRPPNWKAAAPAPLPGTTTFAHQTSLPKLPVPELPATLAHLKEALKPLAKSEAEYIAAVTKIDEFGQGSGKVLQDRLLRRDAETKHWLEEWWDDIAYLGYRDSVRMPRPPPANAS
jgi:carnitine O-acetyltransferase